MAYFVEVVVIYIVIIIIQNNINDAMLNKLSSTKPIRFNND